MSQDLNDKLKAGTLPKSLKDGARPVNAKAAEADENAPPRIYSVKELLDDSATRAQQSVVDDGSCTTGHWELDEVTGGFTPGFVWVFGADTSYGKSSLFVSVADENIRRGKRVLIVSAEDPPSLYGDRLLARRAQVSASRLRKKCLEPAEIAAVKEVQSKAEDCPVYIHAGSRPIEKLAKNIEAIIRLEGIHMVVFDYLQEFRSSGKHQDQRTQFKHTSSVMRDLIRSNNKCGAIVSQLTINGDTKIPNKHNIRESRDVSNAAEVIGIGFIPETDIMKPGTGRERDVNGNELQTEVLFKAGKRYILVDKNKNGPNGRKVEMRWNEHSACFDAVHDPEQERLNAEAARYTELTGDFYDEFN